MGPIGPIGQIRERMRELGLEAFFVLTKLNRQYLSGFTGSQGILVITKRGAALYVDNRYLLRARRESGVKVREIGDIGEIRGKIGVEDRITLKEFAWLKKQLPRRRWKVTHNLVEDLRAVKIAREIRDIKRGAAIVDKIFWEIVKGLKWGKGRNGDKGRNEITEGKIAFEIARLAKKFGAQGLAFEPIVAWGPNAAAPHHNPGSAKIRRNNFLLLDFGVVVGGMHSDFTRTLVVGRPKRWQEEMYEAVRVAQEAGIREIGGIGEIRGKRVDQVVRGSIAAAGYGRYFTHNTGHGVGLEIHELPNLSPDSDDILRAGQIVTVEPGIYIEGRGGVRIEDMIVTGKRPQVLSKVPKDLKSMIIN